MDSHIHVLGLKPSLRLSKFVPDKFVRLGAPFLFSYFDLLRSMAALRTAKILALFRNNL